VVAAIDRMAKVRARLELRAPFWVCGTTGHPF
jgi:hypothetical protein